MKVLALAYVYPPDAGSGTYRSLYFLNHLAALGEEITVITARTEDFSHTAMVDADLNAQIDPRIRVLRAAVKRPVESLLRLRDRLRGTSAAVVPGQKSAPAAPAAAPGGKSFGQSIRDAITTSLTFPDEHIGWMPDVMRQVASLGRFDCLYSTGGPWSSHVAAARISRKYDLPLVLDFRDPWASNPDLTGRSGTVRAGMRMLERYCVRTASQVTLNTDALRDDFVRRYPSIDANRFTTITNGFEELGATTAARTGQFTVVHAGEIYLSRNPAAFLRAVLNLIRSGTVPLDRIVVRLVGGCSRNPEVDELLATDELKRVIEIIGRVPHREALQYQMAADTLLLFQTGFPLQIPRKIFEYMSLLKPVLAIAEPDSATARIVNDSRVGVVAEQNVESIMQALLHFYRRWESGEPSQPERSGILRYRNDVLATRMRDVMRSASGVVSSAETSTC